MELLRLSNEELLQNFLPPASTGTGLEMNRSSFPLKKVTDINGWHIVLALVAGGVLIWVISDSMRKEESTKIS